MSRVIAEKLYITYTNRWKEMSERIDLVTAYLKYYPLTKYIHGSEVIDNNIIEQWVETYDGLRHLSKIQRTQVAHILGWHIIILSYAKEVNDNPTSSYYEAVLLQLISFINHNWIMHLHEDVSFYLMASNMRLMHNGI